MADLSPYSLFLDMRVALADARRARKRFAEATDPVLKRQSERTHQAAVEHLIRVLGALDDAGLLEQLQPWFQMRPK